MREDFHQPVFRTPLSQMMRVINELFIFFVLMYLKETPDVP
jgi:hypothetical protein